MHSENVYELHAALSWVALLSIMEAADLPPATDRAHVVGGLQVQCMEAYQFTVGRQGVVAGDVAG